MMKQKVYISDEERQKCRTVADAFAELKNEEIDIVVADAGRYGFVRLLYYDESLGFDKIVCYTNSVALFNEQLFQIALKNPPLMDLEYEDIFKALPEEKQKDLMRKHHYFAQRSGITDA